jgi:hypothetical protein
LKSFDGSKYYLLKEGMAWGKIPGAYGKLFLTLFRVCAVGGIVGCAKNLSCLVFNCRRIGIDSVFTGNFDSQGNVTTFFRSTLWNLVSWSSSRYVLLPVLARKLAWISF